MATQREASLDLDALHRLNSTEPPVWLAPRVDLSETARTASKKLFSFLRTYAPKSPLDQLLVEGFDAEQIWQQIDLQSQPLLSGLKREVKKFEKNPEEIGKIRKILEGEKKAIEDERKVLGEESDDFEEELDDGFDDVDEDEEEEEEEEKIVEELEEGSESKEEDNEEEDKGKGEGIEDKFLKINELQEYLEEDEAREYGLMKDNNSNKKKGGRNILNDEGEEDEDEDEEDEDELGLFDGDDEEEEDEDMQKLETAKYEDFFGGKNKKVQKKKLKSVNESEEDSGFDDDDDDDDDDEEEEEEEEEDDEAVENQKSDSLSTHEKQLKKLKSEIEKMEKANLDPKSWTMQGEVTAAQRPKNSALEVDLDFQHNVRPAPVITEEFTASLEEMIKKRVMEGQFDDVQKASSLPSKAPKELKELDENKSKKGLAEVYEEEYVQKTNPAAAPLSFSDEQKKEASMLFKKLCLKLDALSHFHFSPKPVIEDMSVQSNVPALAMEEIAPIAVSDAAMLAPEEIFAGKGDIKEEAELTQAERKRRRANKKRRFKAEAEKRMASKKARDNTLRNQSDATQARKSCEHS